MSNIRFPFLRSDEDAELIPPWFDFRILRAETLIPPPKPIHLTGHCSALVLHRPRLSAMHMTLGLLI